jgi:hypothetical protein
MQKLVERVLRLSRVPGPYFPLRRYGDHVVVTQERVSEELPDQRALEQYLAEHPGLDELSVIDRPGGVKLLTATHRTVEFFENRGEAERHAQGLRAAGRSVRGPLIRREAEASGVKLTHNDLSEIMRDVRVGGRVNEKHLEAVETALREAMIRLLPSTAIQKSTLHRAEVAGANEDQIRAFANHALASARYESALKNSMKTAIALQRMKDVRDALGREETAAAAEKQNEASRVIAELEKREKLEAEHAEVPWLAERLTQFGFIWYLLSPSYWVTNMLQPLMTGLPVLAARHGMGNAQSAMWRALKATDPSALLGGGLKAFGRGVKGGLVPADFQLVDQVIAAAEKSGHRRAGELKEMIEAVGREGLIDLSFSMQLGLGARHGATGARNVGRAIEYMRDLTAIMPHAIEVMNRTLMAIAAYDLAMSREGTTKAQAIAYAKQVVDNTQFDYSRTNEARIFKQWPVLKPVLMFKKYAQGIYYLMVSNVAASVKGATPEERRVARRAVIGLLMSHGLMAGSLGLVFEPLKLAIALVALVFGDDDPWDYQEDARWLLSEMFGPELGEVVARGLPRAIGLDFSSRMGLSNLLAMEGPQSGKPADVNEWVGRLVLGPVGAAGVNFVDGLQALKEGDTNRFLQRMTPKGVKDVIAAWGLGEEGMTDRNGMVLRQTADLGPGAILAKALGFQPRQVAEAYERREAILGAERRGLAERQLLLERYWRGRGGERASTWADIRRFNRDNPAFKITRDSLEKSMQQRQKRQQGLDRMGGVYLPASRQSLLGLGGAYGL